MTALEDARQHLAKAREFFEAAQFDLDLRSYNVASSNAVICAINAKDVICLVLTGVTGKSENHAAAVDELGRVGRVGADLASTFSRLVQLKTKSQYTPLSISATDAVKAVEWAQRLLPAAEDVVAGR